MTRDDIIRMAEECGIPEFENNESQADNILHFADLVAAAEREACAEVCHDYATRHGLKGDDNEKAQAWMMLQCAAAIRARSET
jgi:hypothetical protein